ncbi:hypothetical protein [Burkholderia anthina]|uniref:hypothetical protein n=1 Tax=Burkholderia anthina TaxID=179879 RepID=UPI0015823A13|nr:hypothetical protein [Burkholderia anthina]
MRTKASFGLSVSVAASRRTASGVLNESRFMMVRVEKVCECRGSGTTARAAARCRRRGIERFLIRVVWRKQAGVGAKCDDQRRRHPAGARNGAGTSRTAIVGGRSGTPPASFAMLAVMMISLVFIGLSARICRLQCEFLNPSKTFWIADFRSGH